MISFVRSKGGIKRFFFNLKESLISFNIEQNILLTSQLTEKGIIMGPYKSMSNFQLYCHFGVNFSQFTWKC